MNELGKDAGETNGAKGSEPEKNITQKSTASVPAWNDPPPIPTNTGLVNPSGRTRNILSRRYPVPKSVPTDENTTPLQEQLISEMSEVMGLAYNNKILTAGLRQNLINYAKASVQEDNARCILNILELLKTGSLVKAEEKIKCISADEGGEYLRLTLNDIKTKLANNTGVS